MEIETQRRGPAPARGKDPAGRPLAAPRPRAPRDTASRFVIAWTAVGLAIATVLRRRRREQLAPDAAVVPEQEGSQ